MINLTLIRVLTAGKAVEGILDVPFGMDVIRCHTLENADFLIPEGTFPIEMTHSPKFGKFLPEIKDVPDRAGIRIHTGVIPEHSTGCVLVTPYGKSAIETVLNKCKLDEEDVTITIQQEKI